MTNRPQQGLSGTAHDCPCAVQCPQGTSQIPSLEEEGVSPPCAVGTPDPRLSLHPYGGDLGGPGPRDPETCWGKGGRLTAMGSPCFQTEVPCPEGTGTALRHRESLQRSAPRGSYRAKTVPQTPT